jgi:hypothetical protein
VTLALGAPWRPWGGERAFSRDAEAHRRPVFPRRPHRSPDKRLLRTCHDLLGRVGQELATRVDALRGAYETPDAPGVRPRTGQRRGRGWLAGLAAKGWCPRLDFFPGVTLLTAVTPQGAVTGYALPVTTTSAQARADACLAARQWPQPARPAGGTAACRVYVADTGGAGRAWGPRWAQPFGAHVIAPPKAHDTRTRCGPPARRRAHAAQRPSGETVHDRLLDTCGVEEEWPHHQRGVRARLAAKGARHNFCRWFNRQLGRAPRAFADLIDW